MSQIETISKQAFIPLQEKATANKNYAATLTNSSSGITEIVDLTITTAQLNQLTAIPESSWQTSKFNTISAGGEQGQRGISPDYKWRYECWGDGNWSRDLIINFVYETYIGTIDDSSATFDPATLLTQFPNAVVGQRVLGSGNKYWEKMTTYWMCVKNAGDFKGVAVSDATSDTLLAQFNALLASLRAVGIIGV